MAEKNFLPRCIAFELQIFNDSIGMRVKNAVHLGKSSLPPSLAQSSIISILTLKIRHFVAPRHKVCSLKATYAFLGVTFIEKFSPMLLYWDAEIDDYSKDGGEELFTKIHCVL